MMHCSVTSTHSTLIACVMPLQELAAAISSHNVMLGNCKIEVPLWERPAD
jgi:hypothetical protein